MKHTWLDGVWGGLTASQRANLRRRSQVERDWQPQECRWCGKLFPVTRLGREHCSRSCTQRDYDWRSGRRVSGPPSTRGR